MSILLDALRKSEKRERLGTVPGIHSQEPAMHEPSERGYGRAAWLLIGAIFLLIAWLAWKQFAPVQEGPQSQQASVQDSSSAAGQPRSAQPAAGTADQEAESRPATDPIEMARSLVRSKNDSTSASGSRTPMESLPPAQPDPATEQSAPSAQASSPGSQQLSDAAAADSRQYVKPGQTAPAGADPSAYPQQPQAESAAAAGGQDEPFQPSRKTPPISYWALPSNIRGEIPELKISVLVFAERPADRFVLLNGRRQVEGDVIVAGLRLVEIRRDGAVFSYRMYRFFIRQ